MTKTLFRYLSNGQKFRALNGKILIKRRGLKNRTIFCFEEQKTVRLNAIVPGKTMWDANNTEFIHFCPLDYALVD